MRCDNATYDYLAGESRCDDATYDYFVGEAVPKRKTTEAADISIVFIGEILDCLVTQRS
jgi:hypothetical protein